MGTISMEKGKGLEIRTEPSHAELCRVSTTLPDTNYMKQKHALLLHLQLLSFPQSLHPGKMKKNMVKCFMLLRYRSYN